MTAGTTAIPGEMVDRVLGPVHIAVQYALVSLLAYVIASYATVSLQGTADLASIGALWAMISGIVVMQETRKSTLNSAWLRILGSLAGAIISAIYLLVFPFNPVGMAILIGITVLLCQGIGIPGHARLAALTVAVVLVVSGLNPEISPLVNAATRFIEVIIGSVVAVAVVWVWPYVTGATDPAPGDPRQ
jgi:uncharacterized membrane protein YccC